jgi:glucoamylase
MSPLAKWAEQQYRRAAAGLLAAISPTHLIKLRPGFGQRMTVKRGAILASPVPASYDPDPDYFFHWYRDSALVIDALRLLFTDGAVGAEALAHLADFVSFSAELRELDGRALVQQRGWRTAVQEGFAQYVRADKELASVHGDAVLGETRVNPDGTLDFSRWGRPQHDGAALRALALLRWELSAAGSQEEGAARARLLRADLDYVSRHALTPCFDIWEEEPGLHYYTLCVAAAALEQGARWIGARGEGAQADAWRQQARGILAQLDGYWLEPERYYRSRVLASGVRSVKELDVSVLLAVLHAARAGGSHSVHDPKVHATLARLVAQFEAEYPINQGRRSGRAAALGRYPGDVYYSGGAYYFATLAAAELSYRAAASGAAAAALLAQGDGFLETVRAFTPASGEMSEQFDRSTGQQTSAKHLAWSYAAFISSLHARRAAAP